jgi:hypothetical protein
MSLRTPAGDNEAASVVGLTYHRTIIVEAMVWIWYKQILVTEHDRHSCNCVVNHKLPANVGGSMCSPAVVRGCATIFPATFLVAQK